MKDQNPRNRKWLYIFPFRFIWTWFMEMFAPKYAAITIFPFQIYADQECYDLDTLVNHENIHTRQEISLFIIFDWLYLIYNYLKNRYWLKMNPYDSYKNMPSEIEAYENENDMNYIDNSGYYDWLKRKKK